MHSQPPLLPRLNDLRILPQSLHAISHIRLHQPQRPLFGIQLVPPMRARQLHSQFPDRSQPGINDAQFRITQGGSDAAAAGVAAHDDVLHFQVQDRIHDDGLGGEVRGREHVGDVAVHEDVAGLETQDGGLGDAGVGAAEPEDGWMLAGCEGGEEIGMVVGGCVGPLSVLLQGAGQAVGGCDMGTYLSFRDSWTIVIGVLEPGKGDG